MNDFAPARPVCFVSPHLDDAALSCASFLSKNPGSIVITALSGAPDTDHDGYNATTTGETYAPKAIAQRRREDADAMALLSAQPVWIDLYDNDYLHQFPRTADKHDIMAAIDREIEEAQAAAVVAPLGFVHSDHVAVSNACLQLSLASTREWYLYMDMPYAQTFPKELDRRLRDVRRVFEVESLEPFPANGERKREAVKCYQTQYGPISRDQSGFEPAMIASEQYWRVRGRRQRRWATPISRAVGVARPSRLNLDP